MSDLRREIRRDGRRLRNYRRVRRGLVGIVGSGVLMMAMVPLASQAAGILEFFAQGEDLATAGFVAPKLTKDGWELRFEHIFVSVAEVTAYQTDPPFDPAASASPAVISQVILPGIHTLDLVQDAADDDRIRMGSVEAAPGAFQRTVLANGSCTIWAECGFGDGFPGDRQSRRDQRALRSACEHSAFLSLR